jgi:mono/diheme cytochrome c family protein
VKLRPLRVIAVALGALLVAGAGGAAWVYAASEAHLDSFARPPPFSVPIPGDAAAVARGDHLVRTRGCRGCHGDDLGGQQMWGHAVAPNLVELARTQDAAIVEAALRHGIDRNGRAFYDMPSYNFVRLRDADVADIIAYLRAAPLVHHELPRPSLPWSIRWKLARGTNQAIAGFLPHVPPLRQTNAADQRLARGEYIAMTTCNECHGLSLRADSPFDDETAPDLVVILGYDEAAFTRLMRSGLALGERELPMMSPTARGRFAHFSAEEVHDLYTFLHDMASRAAAVQ